MMDTNYKNNMEINIPDLFWNIVYRWKIILLVAVLGMVLGVGYKVHSNAGIQSNMEGASSGVELSAEDQIASLQSDMTEIEQANVEFALAYSEKLEEHQRYREESTYINLNADVIDCVTITYMIDNGYTFSYQGEVQPNNASALQYAYTDYIDNGMLVSDIADALPDIAAPYLHELIYASQGSDADAIEMVGVKVYGKDEAQAKQIAAEVEKAIDAYSGQVKREVGEHELKLVGDAAVIVSDSGLAAAQNALDASLIDYRTKIANYRDAFSDSQKELYDLLAGKEDAQTDQDGSKPAEKQAAATEQTVQVGLLDGAPKFGVLGCVAGAFLSCMIIACIYLFSGYVKTAEEFSDLFGLYLLGDYDEITEGKSKLETLRRKQKWTLGEKRELTIANLKVLCKKYGIEHIYLASTLHLEKDAVKEMGAIVNALRDSNIEAVWGENVLRDAAAMEMMSSYEYVVLVEKTNMSRYESVAQLLSARNEQNNKSLGVIVL